MGESVQALEGIKVIEVGRALAAPMCALMLADLGADVVKIEQPGVGDDSRAWPPFQNGESTYFLSFNRNKRSVAVDLSTVEGQQIVRRLARTADVFVENFRYGVMDKWGLGYESLREQNPGLVYCSITGFGEGGPSAHKPASDIYMQAFGGLMSITGDPTGGPVRTGVSICDLTTGMFAAYGIVAALNARNTTGTGQLVSTSLLESQIALLSYHLTAHGLTGAVPGRLGSGHPNIAPYQAFQASDGWVVLAAFNDRLFARACRGLGIEDLAQESRFATNPDRMANLAELAQVLDARFNTKPVAHWIEVMEELDVPLAPVNTVADLVADPQVIDRGAVRQMQHPSAGAFTTFAFPAQLSDTPAVMHKPPPELAADTEDVLRDLGLEDEEMSTLGSRGVIGLPK